MKVLHVLPTRAPEYGGPVRVAEAHCAQLKRLGHQVALFAPSGGGVVRTAYWPGASALRRLAREVSSADLVHVHGLWTIPGSAAASFARRSRRPFVVTPHGMLDRWSLRRSAGRKRLYAALIERGNLNAAASLHFLNAEEADEAADFGLRAPSFILPNGVYLEELSGLPGRAQLERRYPRTRGRRVVLFLGRLHPKKGVRLLVDALSGLGQGAPIHLVVAGPDEGGHRAELEALVKRLALEDAVTFTGPVAGEDKRLLLGGADVFALTSHQEGDSVAVKEALAARLPVLITHACHFPEVLREGAGEVVSPEVGEVRAGLLKVLADESARSRMAENARVLAQRYRWDAIGERLVDAYSNLLRGLG